MVTFAVTVPAAVAVAAALILVGVATCKLPRGREAPRSVIPTQAFFAYRQGERKGERASAERDSVPTVFMYLFQRVYRFSRYVRLISFGCLLSIYISTYIFTYDIGSCVCMSAPLSSSRPRLF